MGKRPCMKRGTPHKGRNKMNPDTARYKEASACTGQPAGLEEMEGSLLTLLSKLRANREKVPLEILKTTYSMPYGQLLDQVKKETEGYVRLLALTGLILSPDDREGQYGTINRAIQNSGLLKEISHAAFQHYDLVEIKKLALQLRHQIDISVWPYIERHSYMSFELNSPEKPPKIYNTVLNAFYEDGRWLWRQKRPRGFLIIKAKDEARQIQA